MQGGISTISPVIQEAPVFYPSEEDWENPIKYIKSIRPRAEHAGICKIVPPKSFKPPLALDMENFRFRTRVQTLCKIEAMARLEREFMHDLRISLYKRGTPFGLHPLPLVPSQLKSHVIPLRLYQLYRAVQDLGGGIKVSRDSLWSNVATRLFGDEYKYDEKLAQELEKAYEYYLSFLDGEERTRQSELMNSANLKMKLDFDLSSDELLKYTLQGIQTGVRGSFEAGQAVIQATNALEKSKVIEASLKKRKSNPVDELDIEIDADKSQPLPEPTVGSTFYKYFPDMEKCLVGKVIDKIQVGDEVNWHVKFLGADRESAFIEEVDTENLIMLLASGESKECAKYAFLDGICQVCFRASRPESLLICDGCNFAYHTFCLTPKLNSVPDGDWFCPVCLEDYEEEEVDTDLGSEDERPHREDNSDIEEENREQKLEVRMNARRQRRMLSSFGFGEGQTYSIAEYKQFADNFKLDYLEKLRKANPTCNIDLFIEPTSGKEKRKAAYSLEQEYWRLIVENARASDDSDLLDLTVSYGSDLDTGVLGSGFSTLRSIQCLQKKVEQVEMEISRMRAPAKLLREKERLQLLLTEHEKYAKSEWNLNNLPTASGSLLQYVDANITGVMVPWLYMGMCFSSFCWHTEDHYFASINYHHFGAAKTWYGVPGSQADRFEIAARSIAPELFNARADLLTGIVTQFHPSELARYNVPVYHTVQQEGDFVLTFPRAYHGGFNHGFNCAEAVNFATPDWLQYGDECLQRYVELKKTPVISHEALLCSLYAVVIEKPITPAKREIALKLHSSFRKMVEAELATRSKFRSSLKTDVSVVNSHPGFSNGKTCGSFEMPKGSSYSSSGVKRKAPGKMGPVSESTTFKEGRERNTELVNAEPTSSMSRMGGVRSSLYKNIIQCENCRRYCALSYVWRGDKGKGYCIGHGFKAANKAGSYFVELYPDGKLTAMLGGLSKLVKSIESENSS